MRCRRSHLTGILQKYLNARMHLGYAVGSKERLISESIILTQHLPLSPRPFHHPQQGSALHCGKVSLETLAKRHGTPLYVYSADQIVERLELFQNALAGREHLVCYSVKVNSALAILKLLAGYGAGFDIVSGGELERVLAAAPEAVSRIVFSGVGKTAAEIDLALTAGILELNVESAAELDLLARTRRQTPAQSALRPARQSRRVRRDPPLHLHRPARAQIRHRHTEGAEDLQERRQATAGLSRTASAFTSARRFAPQLPLEQPWRRVSKLLRQLEREGIVLQTVDAGGGLGINYHSGKFDAAAKVREYATAIQNALAGYKGCLLIEPGRFIVAQAGALVTRVLQVKRNGKKTFVITDAAMNDLIRPALYQAYHQIVPVRPRAGKPRIVDVVGPICETGDFFARDRQLAPVEPGDSACNSRYRSLWHGRKLQLQHPTTCRRGAGGRSKGTADTTPGDDGRPVFP